jgi:hypothetical protein
MLSPTPRKGCSGKLAAYSNRLTERHVESIDGYMRVLRRKEVALMRRLIFMATLALVVAVMMAVAGPAFAAIHQLARMECASDSAQNGRAEEVVQDQDPPGLEGQSNADNEMQSTRSVSKNETAASHAFKPDVCPAPDK